MTRSELKQLIVEALATIDAERERINQIGRTENVKKNAAQLSALFNGGISLAPLYKDPNKKYPVYIFSHGGRYTVAPVFNGFGIIPFYLSTGAGGKKGVPAGKWYPFFGIGNDGWINKTNGTDMVNYYFSNTLKKVANALNNDLPDPKPDNMLSYANTSIYGEIIPTKKFKDVINRDLNPTDSSPDFEDTGDGTLQREYAAWKIPFIKNMYKALDAVHGRSETYPREKYKDILS